MRTDGCNCQSCQHQLCARRVPVFSVLSQEEIGQVVSLIVRKHYVKGEQIPVEGSLNKSLIIVNEGRIKTFRLTPDGKEHILYIFSEGDFLGEMNLLSRSEATYSAEALEDTHICVIHKDDFQNLIRRYPDISIKIMEELCSRLERMEGLVESMGSKDVDSRVNMVLVEFSKEYGKDTPRGRMVELPLSREGIANYIGVTRETVSRKLSRLQDEGVIELIGNKKVLILDEKTLEM